MGGTTDILINITTANTMSIWRNISQRSEGITIRKEDNGLIYGGCGKEKLFEDKYQDFVYEIWTTGDYPYIVMKTETNLKGYTGAGNIEMKDTNGDKVIFNRYVLPCFTGVGWTELFKYVCDKNNQKKYTLGQLKNLAKHYINILILGNNAFLRQRSRFVDQSPVSSLLQENRELKKKYKKM
jgi:hypothetical protein